MAGDRLLRILSRLIDAGTISSAPAGLCDVSAEVLGVTGAGIILMSGDIQQGSICSSDPVSALIEDLQFTLGEGPSLDAYRRDYPILEPELASHGPARWAAFTPPAVTAGVAAVFGFPMRVGATRLGVLGLYRDRPGPLTDDQHADAMVMTGVAARSVLGMTATELEEGSNLRLVVHQASGMVSVQLDVTLGEALVRMRAAAFAENRPLDIVAADVVARRIRFQPPEDDPIYNRLGPGP